jgi:ribosomal protein L32
MTCQICGAKSGFYPICKNCSKLKDEGKVTKCEECGIWKKDNKPLCHECFFKKQKESNNYKKTEIETEDDSFRSKFKAEIRAEDGHLVRSKAEKIIDDWLYHQGIAHAYERKVPNENVYCDFFIPKWNIWIEFWGLYDEKYLKRKELKKKIYLGLNKKLIELTEKDIEKIDDVMPEKLKPFLPQNFNFD